MTTPFDITIFTKGSKGWETQQLKKAAEKYKLKLNVLNPISLNNWQDYLDKIGRIVIWRGSTLHAPMERSIFLKLFSNRIIYNQAVFQTSFIAHKLYQQKKLERYSKIKGMRTYHFHTVDQLHRSIENQTLIYPFVVKKDIGRQGKNVHLVNQKEDLDFLRGRFDKYIFQNYVDNDGDYRVFVFGGKVLGIMKRTSTDENEFRNNISLGGKANKVEDEEVIKKLTVIGLKTASLFNLQLCGVDIIYDKKDETYRIMEVNTVPQWQGLQSVCKVNIGEEIIKHCKLILQRKRNIVPQLVKNFYRLNYRYLSYRQFHYVSRHYLWFGHEADQKRLRKFKEKYYTQDKLKEIFDNYYENQPKINRSNFDKRQKYLEKYPDLKISTRILFRYLWAKYLFEQDIRPLVEQYLTEDKLISLQKKILADELALRGLSTSAINFLYLSREYLGRKSEKIKPNYLLDVINKFTPQDDSELRLKIYFLTHCLIGASLFYIKDINSGEKKLYRKLVKELEKLVKNNYFQVTLDNKFEFLVTAKLADYSSNLREIIESEARSAFSLHGNYLIDQLNQTEKIYGDNIISSEHRNILYLMAMFPRSNPLN